MVTAAEKKAQERESAAGGVGTSDPGAASGQSEAAAEQSEAGRGAGGSGVDGSSAPDRRDTFGSGKDADQAKERALLGLPGEPAYERVPEEDLPPRLQGGNLTTREINDRRDAAVAADGGGAVSRPVPAGQRPGESSDPVVHQILAELQDAQTNEDEDGQKRLGQRLADMGYDVG